MSYPKDFPKKGHDAELGDIEWIFPDTSEEDKSRINAEVEKKIDILESNL